MRGKSANIIYGVNEKPPVSVLCVMVFQHLFLMSSSLILPVVIVQEIGGSFLEVRTIVSLALIAMGIGTFLQALSKGPIGSGYLAPSVCGPTYLMVSIHAAWFGGLPLMQGMMMIAGLFEMFFSKVLRFLKFLFPAEITGLVVLMVGINLIPLGVSKFLGINYAGDSIVLKCVLIGIITLSVMTGVNVWSKSRLRLYCVLIGLMSGYSFSYFLGIITPVDFNYVLHSPMIAIPFSHYTLFKWSFRWSFVLPFVIVSLCSSLKTFGNITTAQKNSHLNWKQIDFENVSKGLLSDGLSVISSGLLGGVALETSASCIGMSIATGVMSRSVAFVVGIFCIILGFCPKIAAILSVMPLPVMGATLIFVTCFIVLSGFQIILGEELNVKKTFVIGISLIFGLSVDILPDLYTHLALWLQPIFSSSITVTTLMAMVLHQIFNIEQYIQSKEKKKSK